MSYVLIPSITARAAMYWRKPTGAWVSRETGWRTMVEKMRQPAGDTQTLLPRPRPATWTVVVAVKPVGRRRSNWVFLIKKNTPFSESSFDLEETSMNGSNTSLR